MGFTFIELKEIAGLSGWAVLGMFTLWCVYKIGHFLAPHVGSFFDQLKGLVSRQTLMCDKISENSDRHTASLEMLSGAVKQQGDHVAECRETLLIHSELLSEIRLAVRGK